MHSAKNISPTQSTRIQLHVTHILERDNTLPVEVLTSETTTPTDVSEAKIADHDHHNNDLNNEHENDHNGHLQ